MSNINEVIQILESGSLDSLIDTFETSSVEFKRQPYRLDEAQQKFELAKDVSALANSGGGIIIIGVETSRRDDSLADYASKIRPIKRSLCNLDQMRQCVAARTFPSLDIKLSFIQVEEGEDKVLVLCEVSTPNEKYLPVLVRDPCLIEDETKPIGSHIGIFERAQSHTHFYSVEKVHALIQAGQGMIPDISSKLDYLIQTIHTKNSAFLSDTESKPIFLENSSEPSDEFITEKFNSSVTHQAVKNLATVADLDEMPYFWLSADPKIPFDLSRILESKHDPIVRLIEDPPVVREGGFDLRLNQNSTIVEGDRRRVILQKYGALELSIQGRLLFVGHEDLLCWGRRKRQENSHLINQLALTELVLLFSELVSLVFSEANYSGSLRLAIGLSNFCKDQNIQLEPGPLSEWNSSTPKTVSESSLYVFIDTDAEDLEKGASELIGKVYNRFGYESDQAPYMRINTDNIRVIDKKIVASGGHAS